MSAPSSNAPEFSRPLKIDRLGAEPEHHAIEASAAERAALARRFDLVAIKALSASLALERVDHGQAIKLDGRVRAEIVQSCVVSLAEVTAQIDETFMAVYAPGPHGDEMAAGETIDESTLDDPEPLIGDTIDLGEAVVQQLATLIDPYPRAPGIELADVWQEKPAEHHPFAALAQLKTRGH